jgi:hypothetical protein
MDHLLPIIITALLYPGLLTALAAGGLYRLLLRHGLGQLPAPRALGTREGLAASAGVLLSAMGLALLPWPLHPGGDGTTWFWAWAAFELAFLLPLLPALMAGTPAVVRAALREAQLGGLARALLWAALVATLTLHSQWESSLALVAHLLSLGAALVAFPVAVGWGPFGPEEWLTPGGAAAGLDEAGQRLDAWTRDLRAGALLAALLVAALPLGALPPMVGLAVWLLGYLIAVLLLREFAGRLPRMTLPGALRFCLLWPLPLALAATLALAAAVRWQ